MTISNINNVYQLNNMQLNKQKEAKKQEEKQIENNLKEQKKVETNQKENIQFSKEAMERLHNNQKTQEFRQEKVDEMKKKISNGEFQVNANKIADKLLQQYKQNSML